MYQHLAQDQYCTRVFRRVCPDKTPPHPEILYPYLMQEVRAQKNYVNKIRKGLNFLPGKPGERKNT